MRVFKLSVLLGALALAACGELSYKRGGSAQEIEQAHRACRGSGEQLSACLTQHGWEKPQLDAFDPLFATVSVTDNRQGALVVPMPENIAPASAQIAATPTVPSAVAKQASEPTNTTSSDQKVEQAVAHVHPAPVLVPPARATANDPPETVYSINSWWKMGAFPDQLKKDQLACEQKLGEAFKPNYATQSFKRGFVACMHAQGWMAVRNVK